MISSSILALGSGSTWIAPSEVINALLGKTDPITNLIVQKVRLPAVFLAAIVGGLLGSGGASMQAILRNPLADPYILGISGGAAVGATSAMVFFPDVVLPIVPIAAFGGAMTAVMLIYAVANRIGQKNGLVEQNVQTLLLIGVIFNSLASAGVLVLFTIVSPRDAQEVLFWLIGSVSAGRTSSLERISLFIISIIGIGALSLMGQQLNLLTFGDTDAKTLGVAPNRVRKRVFFITSVMVGAAVAYTGLIGFVGLVVPHITRFITGADHKRLIPISAIIGSTFLILADAIARTSFYFSNTTLPVGAVTAMIGAPLFAVILIRNS